jgi:hypothetical protein
MVVNDELGRMWGEVIVDNSMLISWYWKDGEKWQKSGHYD